MDSLQDCWSEPIIRVQSLSESGITAIPDRYVKPPSDRPTVERLRNDNIPVIDLAGLAGGSAECRATMQAMSDACREWGFFQAVNHGVRPELMKAVREVWRSFFYLPAGDKEVYANSPKTHVGYGSRLGVEKRVLDWGDYFYLKLLPHSIPDKWPAQPSSCREITEEYGREVVRLCGIVMKVLSMNLGLDVNVFEKAFGGDDIEATLRVNYYPKCPQPDLTFGLSAHSDPGGLTVLLPDNRVNGLQVRRGADEWVTVQTDLDALIINVGDQIQVLSNAVYKSVEHRVMVNKTSERISIALFYNPRGDLPLGPVPELVTPDRPPLYRPMTYDEYRLYILKSGTNGKVHVDTRLLQYHPCRI